ncbi:39S ribosomal protein L3, mitochondrial-like isoform X2 [Homarus americanus]|uniref:39S ribosomal protein L3, mitochondrial-like isoform X2 n=1 Tax=Homarus americanus TaxID=6706 RepID=UPI001C43B5AB|nr:39S ribosomal protein L3, mitochondrial-like isoform X2 [Homarus americanus]
MQYNRLGHLTRQDTSSSLGPLAFATQIRNMSRVKRRHSQPPFWLPKTTRTMYPEELTPENESYVSEVIADQYSSPLKSDPWERGAWHEKSIRCGVIARKIGIYPMWTKNGTRLLTTLLQVTDNHVIKYIPPEDLMETEKKANRLRPTAALIVGADAADPRMVTKEFFSLFSETGILPKKKLSKFLITPNAKLAPGTPLYASHFRPGNYVDVAGVTIDRGFQGVMKRWGFKGMPASHGVTKSHRRGGTIGSGGEKARVLPGQKMPGHMGRERRILKGLKVWRINTHYNVLWVSGPAIPGSTGSYVYIYDSFLPTRKYTAENHPPFPTLFQDEQEIDEELYDPDLHVFSEPAISFADEK